MLDWVWRLNNTRRLVRWPIKCTVVGLTLLFVCFPNPLRLVDHLRHWRDPNALIEPAAPELRPMIDALEPQLAMLDEHSEVLKQVEQFVYREVPYEWDWNTWGAADYFPTVAEVVERGQEDCDGRAVVAASLLSHFGYETQLVTNFAHVWVHTNHGDAMGPGKRRAVVATDKGLTMHWRGLLEVPRAFSFGIAVFPLMRELILITVIWLMLLTRHAGFLRQALLLVAVCVGLFMLRASSHDFRAPNVAWQLVAVVIIVAAVVLQLTRPFRTSDRHIEPSLPEGDNR